jgi:hypothetical protein
MTRRRFDIPQPASHRYAEDLRHAIPMTRDTPFRCPEPGHRHPDVVPRRSRVVAGSVAASCTAEDAALVATPDAGSGPWRHQDVSQIVVDLSEA